MPGFAEYSNHNSEFNARISDREVRKRQLESNAFYYFESLGLDSIRITYKVRGNKLIFDYKMLTPCFYPNQMQGNYTTTWYRRTVDLDNRSFVDKPIKPKKVSVAYNAYLSRWLHC